MGRGRRVDWQRMRSRLEKRLQGLDFGPGFDSSSLCRQLEVSRKRPIVVRAIAMPAGMYGLTLPTDRADYVFHEANTSEIHRQHIIIHECSHLICGHKLSIVAEELVQDITASAAPQEAVAEARCRYSYTDPEEVEAEFMASLIHEKASGAAPRPGESVPEDYQPRDREALRRIRSFFDSMR